MMAKQGDVITLIPLDVLQKCFPGASELRLASADGRIGAAEFNDLLGCAVLFLFIGPQVLNFHSFHPPQGGFRPLFGASAPSST